MLKKSCFSVYILFLALAIIQLGAIASQADPRDPVLATVNGFEIRESELTPALERYLKKAGKTEVTKEEKMQILKGVIRRHLLLTNEVVQNLRENPDVADKVKAFENDLVVKTFLKEKVGKEGQVTDVEMRDYYKKNRHLFPMPQRVKARHILLRTQEEAENVLAMLKDGADFSELAKRYSIDLPLALEGGSMGIIEKGKTFKELDEALFLLAKGEISDIVKTKFGYHILTIDEYPTGKWKPYEEVMLDINKILRSEKESEAFQELMTSMENAADIHIFSERVSLSKK